MNHDTRCARAKGPTCRCSCEGLLHGASATVRQLAFDLTGLLPRALCPDCGGSGEIGDGLCDRCHGAGGYRKRVESIVVRSGVL